MKYVPIRFCPIRLEFFAGGDRPYLSIASVAIALINLLQTRVAIALIRILPKWVAIALVIRAIALMGCDRD